ncbi:MAG: LemA family protein [Firmicutes bacterium]|nr:LemA family protein [Bacillota bacterium]
MKYIVLGLLAILLIYIISTINSFVYLKKRIDRSKSLIDVYLKKRFDLIPNLVETVKGYTKYEKKTLEEITKLRENFNELKDEESGNKLNEHYKKILAVVEAYPEIKASENFLNLQKNLEKVESEISASRRIYISDITNYNTKVETFPNNILASIFKHRTIELPLYESEEIKINFD